MPLQRYARKREEVEAIQWTEDNEEEVCKFCPLALIVDDVMILRDEEVGPFPVIAGEYIVKEHEGCYVIYSEVMFLSKYEPVE